MEISTNKPLPLVKQRELARVREIIVNRLEDDKHDFVLEKIILFGSYARGNWVEDGYVKDGVTYDYKSDFDILVVTQKGITEGNWLGLCIDEHIDKHPGIRTEVNVIHHGIDFLNRKIEENYYFFVDIAAEGVLLYDTGRYQLAKPGAITPATQSQKAQEDFEYWFEKGHKFYEHFEFDLQKRYYSEGAFHLHQATEAYYSAILLVHTDYKPRGHNIHWLGKQAIGINERFREVFPMRTKRERALFRLLKKAYIDSRYRKDYAITAEELQYLSKRVLLLRALTEELCDKEIARLKGLY